MRINLDIDDNLVREAIRSSGARTKKEVVEEGLRALVGIRAQAGMQQLRGTVTWEGNLDVSRRGRSPSAPRSKRKRKASPLDVKGVKLGMSTAEMVAIVREGRERG